MAEKKHQSVHEKLQEISDSQGLEGKDPYEIPVEVIHRYERNGKATIDFMATSIATFDDRNGVTGSVFAGPGYLTVQFYGDGFGERWHLNISSLVARIAEQRTQIKPVGDHTSGCICADCAKARTHLKRGIRQQEVEANA